MLRMRQDVVELAVIRHEEQPFGVIVKASDRENALTYISEIVHDRAPPLRVGDRRDDIIRLVEEEIAFPLRADAFSGDLYAIGNRISFAPQLADDLAIHTDLSRCDQFFSLAAGADARMAQYLL